GSRTGLISRNVERLGRAVPGHPSRQSATTDGRVEPGRGTKFMPDTTLRSATISVLVENEPGILARVVGLFSGRGYNIDSLTVAPVESGGARSRINIVTS